MGVSRAELQSRKMKVFVLLAAVCHISQSAPQWLSYAAVHPVASVVTGNSVPVAVGGYKAVAGSNGDLAGPVHEVPGLVPALAVQKQESSGDVSLSTGTGALAVTHAVHAVHAPVAYYGKRSAEPQLADAGDNGDLKGAVHEVPGLVPAPALNKQENTNGGALTVGTGAFVKYSLSKRSAEADAAVLASTVSYVNPVSTVYHAAPYAYPYTYAGVHAPLLWG